MSSKTARAILCICLFFALLLGGCADKSDRSAADCLRAMLQAERPLPAGTVYVRHTPRDGESHLSDELLATVFGNGSLPPQLEQVADAAVFFSYLHPCELAVFRCENADGTDAVAEMCLHRLNYLKKNRTDSSFDSTSSAYPENAQVYVRGKWVLMIVSSDPRAAIRAFGRAL